MERSEQDERKNRIESRLKDFPLTKDESIVFAFLLEVAQVFNLNTTLRVAGGWVRDKVIQKKINKYLFFSIVIRITQLSLFAYY